MIVRSAEFVTSAVKPAQYPSDDMPEIAFAGRSNVGKSSLINVLVGRKNLVRTSSTPGRTQLINFFRVNGLFTLVDLPGYGYAKVPLAVKRQWGPMVETYLANRRTLRGVVLILDIRREPTTEDRQMLDWLRSYRITPILVATKCDKLSRNERVKQLRIITDTLGIDPSVVSSFSALSREGSDTIWERIEGQLSGPPVTPGIPQSV